MGEGFVLPSCGIKDSLGVLWQTGQVSWMPQGKAARGVRVRLTDRAEGHGVCKRFSIARAEGRLALAGDDGAPQRDLSSGALAVESGDTS